MSTIKVKHNGEWKPVPNYSAVKGVIDEATLDDKQYARKNGKWAEVNNGIEINENPIPPSNPEAELWVDMSPIQQGVDVPEDAPKDDGIYARMNGGWRDIQDSVRNAANRKPSNIGMGYKVLEKDIPFKDQVKQPNTIYEIRYDFDLNKETVNIPENCALKFEGGYIKGGIINLNKTFIEPNGCNIINCITSIITGDYKEGQMLYDSSIKIIKVWNGSVWTSLDGTQLG